MSSAAPTPVEHPGAFIREELDARGWDQVDLAYILGMSAQQLSPLLNGKRDISSDMAVALGDAFGVSAEFFANLQKQYDLNRAKSPDPGVRTRANWISTFPIREMIQRGWIEDTEADLLDLQMMRLFGTNSIEDIPFVGSGEVLAHAAKKSTYEEITPVQLAWLHRVRVIAQTMECPAYSETSLRRALGTIRAHMNDRDDISAIPHILSECGVRFVIVEHLSGTKIDGVCTWLDDQPVIGISTRLNRMDNFCFVVRHEIEHVIQGDGRQTAFSHVDIFEPDRNVDELPEEERRADQAAAEFLIPQNKLDMFMARKGKFISERDVLAFAARHSIHPAVVIGQIQFRRHKEGDEKAYTWLRKYLAGVRRNLQNWKYLDGWGHIAPVAL